MGAHLCGFGNCQNRRERSSIFKNGDFVANSGAVLTEFFRKFHGLTTRSWIFRSFWAGGIQKTRGLAAVAKNFAKSPLHDAKVKILLLSITGVYA